MRNDKITPYGRGNCLVCQEKGHNLILFYLRNRVVSNYRIFSSTLLYYFRVTIQNYMMVVKANSRLKLLLHVWSIATSKIT